MYIPVVVFLDYALLGDDIVIGGQKVALCYKQWLADLGVSVSMPKSQVSDIGAANQFRVKGVDLSPININDKSSYPRCWVSKLCCRCHSCI